MKSLFAIMMIAFAISLAGFTIVTDPLYVDGKLVVHGHREMKCSFEIIVEGDHKIVASARVETAGRFDLSFTPADSKSYDFFYTDSHHINDTIFLKSYKEFESDELKVTFYTFKGVLPVDKDDHVICPKCNQAGKVSAIEGLPGYYFCARDRIKF